MNVSLGPTIARVSGPIPTQAVETIGLALRYRPKGYQHTTLFRLHRWDGWRSLLQEDQGQYVFPVGLWPRVRRALAATQVPVSLDDTREIIQGTPIIECPNGTILYPDQQDVLQTALASDGRGLLNLATNFGKTLLIACLFLSYGSRKTLVMVNVRKLMSDLARELRTFLQEDVGELGAGRRPRGHERVIVAMPQTARPGAWLDEIEVLLVDEAHAISPVQWFPILGRCPAPIRFGMSGTIKEAPQPLITEAFLGPLLAEVNEKSLVDLGRSAVPTILMPFVEVPKDFQEYWMEAVQHVVGDTGGARLYKESNLYDRVIVHNTVRNRTLIEACQWAVSQNLTPMVLVWKIVHGQLLAQGLRRVGLTADFISGQTQDPAVLDRAVQSLVSGELHVLVASGIFNAGVNIPELNVLVNGAAWKSPLLTRQKLGRVLRKKPSGVNEALLIDPYDWGIPIMERWSDERQATYIKQGFRVSTGKLSELIGS